MATFLHYSGGSLEGRIAAGLPALSCNGIGRSWSRFWGQDMKRFMATLGTVALLSGSIALAHSCFVVNKPVGAGSAGTATLNLDTFEFDDSGVNYNPAGRAKGGFTTLEVSAGGVPIATLDTFNKDMPEGAHNSGPGEGACDGVGIDDAQDCP